MPTITYTRIPAMPQRCAATVHHHDPRNPRCDCEKARGGAIPAAPTVTYIVNLITGPDSALELARYTPEDGDDYVAMARDHARRSSATGRTVETWRDAGHGPSFDRRYRNRAEVAVGA